MCDLSRPEFHDPIKAREWLENELWANGRPCPHCGVVDASTKVGGKTARPGLYMCNACRKQFTVTVGTLYERSHVPLNKWLAATHLMMASKKGMSALEIGRLLGLPQKTAWFLCHRIRESLLGTSTAGTAPMGGKNQLVEADEMYVGGLEKNKHARKRTPRGGDAKQIVMSLVDRDGKRARSFHIKDATKKTIAPILMDQIDESSILMTDDANVYKTVGRYFRGHAYVNHSAGEYVRNKAHTNTVEGFFSIFKRGVVGTFHHISADHLHRYLLEFDFRYNEREANGVSDSERMAKSIQGIVGKRLTYRRPRGQAKGQESLTT